MMTVHRRHAFIFMAVAVVGVPLVACDDGTSAPTPTPEVAQPTATTPVVEPTAPGPTTPQPTATTPEPLGPRTVDGVVQPVRAAYQTKSSAQIRKSIIACFGTNSTTITANMIVGGGGTGVGGSFLTAGAFTVGADIVTSQSGLFDGNPDALKVGVRTDQLSLEYLTALRNAGNVVGYRCLNGLTDDPSLCKCDTAASADAMLQRCIGDVVSPASPQWAALAADFTAACMGTTPSNPTTGKGVAPASLVSSLTFAKLP